MMGHRNQEKAAAQTNYTSALATAQAETPYEKSRRERAQAITDWAKSGDYRTPPNEAKIFYNWANVSEGKAQRELLDNTRGQGVSALGAGANPELLALNKQHLLRPRRVLCRKRVRRP